jgi:hypothetical protein
MPTGPVIFASLIVIGVVAAFIGGYLSRGKLTRRKPLPVSEIVSGLPVTIPRQDASEILAKIGESFDVQPGLLRLDDPIAVLTGMDSWKLGEGQEKLEAWLKTRGVISFQKNPKTIGDLVVAAIESGPLGRE